MKYEREREEYTLWERKILRKLEKYLAKERQAGTGIDQTLRLGGAMEDWLGGGLPEFHGFPMNCTQNRCSLRDGVSAVVGMASGTSSGRRPRLHWDDGWAFIGMTVETSSRWRLPPKDRNFYFPVCLITFVWMTVRLHLDDGSPWFGWRFAFVSVTVRLRLNDGSPSFGWRFAFVWMTVRLLLDDGSPSFGWRFTFFWTVHIRLNDGSPSFGWRLPSFGCFTLVWMTVFLRLDMVDLGLDEGSVLFGQSLKNMRVSPLHGQTTVLRADGDDLIDIGGKRGKQQGMWWKMLSGPQPWNLRCTVGVPLPPKNHWLDEEHMRLINVFVGISKLCAILRQCCGDTYPNFAVNAWNRAKTTKMKSGILQNPVILTPEFNFQTFKNERKAKQTKNSQRRRKAKKMTIIKKWPREKNKKIKTIIISK